MPRKRRGCRFTHRKGVSKRAKKDSYVAPAVGYSSETYETGHSTKENTMRRCVIKGCASVQCFSANICFYSFPDRDSSPGRYSKWMSSIGNVLEPSQAIICSNHFKKEFLRKAPQKRESGITIKSPVDYHLLLSRSAIPTEKLQLKLYLSPFELNSCENASETLQVKPQKPIELGISVLEEEPLLTNPNAEICTVSLDVGLYEKNFKLVLPRILSKGQYVDVTLCAEGKFIECHKVILSSCSAYFEEALSSFESDQHPIVFLKDTPFWALKYLIDFMYAGEIKIEKCKLKELFKVAAALQINVLVGCAPGRNVNGLISTSTNTLPSTPIIDSSNAQPNVTVTKEEYKQVHRHVFPSEVPKYPLVERNTLSPQSTEYRKGKKENVCISSKTRLNVEEPKHLYCESKNSFLSKKKRLNEVDSQQQQIQKKKRQESAARDIVFNTIDVSEIKVEVTGIP